MENSASAQGWATRMPQGWHRKMSPRAVQVMIELGAMLDASGGQVIAPIERMAKDLDCSRRTIEHALDELDRFVARSQPYPGGPNLYAMREPKTPRAPRPETPSENAAPSEGENDEHSQPKESAMAVQGPIIHVTSKSSHGTQTLAAPAKSPLTLPPSPDLGSKTHHPRPHHHQPRETTTHPANSTRDAASGGGGVSHVESGGDEEREQVIADLITLGKITALQAPRLVLKHGADACRRNLALWRTQRNVGAGVLVRMIEHDAAKLTAKAQGIKRRAAEERARNKATPEAAPTPPPPSVPTVNQAERGREIVAALTDAQLSKLADEVLRATPAEIRRRALAKKRAGIRSDSMWLASIAMHVASTPTN